MFATDDGFGTRLKFIYPNSWGKINETDTITEEDDWKSLLDECDDENLAQKLIRAHDSSRIIEDSKLTLHKICAFRIHVKKQPYQYTDETLPEQ